MIYLEDYTSYRSNINDLEVYKELKKYIESSKSEHGEQWGVLGRRWFEFSAFKVYLRINTRLIEGKNYSVIDIANIETRNEQENKGYYTNFLKWCMENSPYSIFIETDEHNVFKIFGSFIKTDNTPTTFNMLEKLGFKQYVRDNTMFYYIKQ